MIFTPPTPLARSARLAVAAVAAALVPALVRAQEVPTAPITLGDAARLAARHSATAQTARFRADQAAARITQRRADLLPNVSASALQSGRTFNTASLGIDFPTVPGQPPIFDPQGQVEGPVNTLDVRGRIAQPLFDAAAFGRVRSARAAADASDADAENAALQAASVAASAYVRVLRASAQLAARTADSTLAEDLLRIARDQLAAGVGVALDVTRAQSQLAGLRSQLIVARNERDRAQLDLRRALGVSLDAPLTLADSLSSLSVAGPAVDEQTAIERALRTRPDLRTVDAQIRATDRQISAIRAERLPAVSAFVDDGALGKNGGYMLNTYTWGVQVSLPIFEGFRREGRIQEQEALRSEADVRRRDLRDQATSEVRAALLDLASAREQVAASRERLTLAEQELAQARDRFAAGVAGNADVITSSLGLNAARTQLNDALTSYQLARVALARAEGSVTELR